MVGLGDTAPSPTSRVRLEAMTIDVQHHGASRPETSNVAFYYDFASPESYLALERIAKALAALTPELIPVVAERLDPLPAPDEDARRAYVEQLAAGQDDLLPLVWPPGFPDLDTADAVQAATYAKSIGKVAVFSLSLFRQIYAAGNDPADVNTLYLAGAASEIHPRAIDQALSRSSLAERAEQATEAARIDGVTSVPALRIGQKLLVGPALLDDATDLLRRALHGDIDLG